MKAKFIPLLAVLVVVPIFGFAGPGDRFTSLFFESQSVRGFDENEQLNVEVLSTGDRFKPVKVNISYQRYGIPAPYEYSASIGRVLETPTGLWIYGDGQLGDGVLTINGEEFLYTITQESICEFDKGTDCYGNRIAGSTPYVIHYSQEDTQVVTWEFAWVRWVSDETVQDLRISENESYRSFAVKHVEQMNTIFRESGVYVKLKLVEIYELNYSVSLDYFRGKIQNLPVDAVIGYGVSYSGSCGVAYLASYFAESRTLPIYGFSRCNADTSVHELGHAAGLHHGPENSGQPGTGKVYPDFGHGTEQLCKTTSAYTYTGSVMSYGLSRKYFSNSEQFCDDGQPRGNPQISDSAFALNMLRYNISLLHDETTSAKVAKFSKDGTVNFEQEEIID